MRNLLDQLSLMIFYFFTAISVFFSALTLVILFGPFYDEHSSLRLAHACYVVVMSSGCAAGIWGYLGLRLEALPQ